MDPRYARAAVAALVLAIGGSASARTGDAAEAASRSAAARTAAAARLAALGSWCQGRSYRQSARLHWRDALRHDPANEAARTGLGHRRGPEGWVEPAKPSAAEDAAITSKSTTAAFERETLTAYAEAAAPWVETAEWCRANGLTAESSAAWREVNRLDPADRRAREALGVEKADDGWVVPRDEGPAAAIARFLLATETVSTRLPALSATEMHQVREAGKAAYSETVETRFRARSYLKEAPARELVDRMLRVEELLVRLKAVPARNKDTEILEVVLMDSKKAYEEAIDAKEDADQKWKDQRKSLSGFFWSNDVYLSWTRSRETALAGAAHRAAHEALNGVHPGHSLPAWIDEGMALLAQTTLTGRVRQWCVSFQGTAFDRDLTELRDWDAEVRTLLRRGEDPDIESLAVAGFNDLSEAGMAKARSLSAWVLSTSPGLVARLAEANPKGARGGEVVFRAFGAPAEAVDRRWRLWALRP